ncbi:protein MCM10 homolog isoform X1 [Mya arenaria]|uniref:protein MCM10 homolog isoform X1 n=1 Tax=Mya arenaria TaxID=6604 RepID=UPI0022E3B5AA|nr:protein MCM10 homolog isoform X1 [Mya arenaria]XP_052779219.1 protein MCM10 homolog isoform X1 [Mya arenaria]
MADECDLEELTAFLEDSDCDEPVPGIPKDCSEVAEPQKSNKDGVINQDEIEAFLQASDEDENDDNTEKGDDCSQAEIEAFLDASDDDVEEQINGENEKGQKDAEEDGGLFDDDFDDEIDDADLKEMDEIMSQSISEPADNPSAPDDDDDDDEAENKTHDTKPNEIVDSHCLSNKAEHAKNDAEESENDLEMDERMSEGEDTAHEREDDDDDPDEGSKDGPKADSETADEGNVSQSILDEMAAMSKRMKELQEMLNASKSQNTDEKKSTEKVDKKSAKPHSRSGKESPKQRSKSKIESQKQRLIADNKSPKHSSRSDKDPQKQHSRTDIKSPKPRSNTDKEPSKHHSRIDKDSPKHHPSNSSTHKSKSSASYTPKGKSSSKSHSPKICTNQTHNRDEQKLLKQSSSTSDRHSDKKSANENSASKKVDKKTFYGSKPKLASKTEDPVEEDNPFFNGPTEKVNAKTLFGESDDSDWDDLAGDEKSQLSKEGKEMKKLLVSGQRQRQAHAPNFDPTTIKKPVMSRWTDTSTVPKRPPPVPKQEGPKLNPETGTVSGKYRLRDEYMPKTTSLVKEDERESVTDPFCGIRIVNPRISMAEFKRKMDGRNMMKISRLLSNPGNADLQKDNWVTMGVVVHKTEPRQSAAGKTFCIWKLSDLQSCEKTVTFFLFGNVYKDHWKNDLGIVVGLLNPSVMDKAEKIQSEVAITIKHPQQLLIMGFSKDLGRCRATTKAGSPCSSFINKMQGEYCTYHVQSMYKKSSAKRQELQASTGVTPKAFGGGKRTNKDGCFFYGGNTYSTNRQQSKKPKDMMSLKKLQSFDSKKSAGKITTMSLHELEPEDELRIQKLEEKDKQLLSMLSVPSAGSMNFVKHLVKKDATASLNGKDGEEPLPSKSALDLLQSHKKDLQQKQVQQKRQKELLSVVPTIGKGLSAGQEFSLDVPVKKKGSVALEFAKQLAIAKIKAKGGISKDDPNAVVQKKLLSPEAKEKIKKRVADDMEHDECPSTSTGAQEPPKKKSKLLGDLDLNSPEVQQLLKKKSKHTGALAEAEAEQEERYFGKLEQRERMEDKMASIKEMDVTLYKCLECKYRSKSLHDRCKKEHHNFVKSKGTQRFFKCKQCKTRTICFDKMPTKACKDCGSFNFERVSMYQEKKGPTLESEELCLRGNEQKYLGSLGGKSFLNA